jgi:hypothetical protein
MGIASRALSLHHEKRRVLGELEQLYKDIGKR